MIDELGIGDQSILVTSRFEEKRTLENCEKLGVSLIPKSMAAFVPISVNLTPVSGPTVDADAELIFRPVSTGENSVRSTDNRVRYDLCLVDDDTFLIHPVWEFEAKARGLSIRMFSSPQEFLSAAFTIDQQTPIYIDVSLGPNISGIDFTHKVFELGFAQINLATGYEPESIKAPHFIRRITGKDFPR